MNMLERQAVKSTLYNAMTLMGDHCPTNSVCEAFSSFVDGEDFTGQTASHLASAKASLLAQLEIVENCINAVK